MKNTILVMSTNREAENLTRACVRQLQDAGAALIEHTGAPSDVACARNIALTRACAALKQHPARDVILCVDDDMAFTLETAQALVNSVRATGVGASAVYATLAGTVAACPLSGHPGRFQTGLGLLALPRGPLLELELQSKLFKMAAGEAYREFVWCGAEGGFWVGEDFRLCRRLGGVMLLPLAAGHIKKQELWPDDATLQHVARGEWQRGQPGVL